MSAGKCNISNSGWRMQALRLGLLSAGKENEVSLVNLFLLKEAQAMIGSFSSGYSKRALELQVCLCSTVSTHK